MDVILDNNVESHTENVSPSVVQETPIDHTDCNRLSGELPFIEECELWCNCTD